MVKALGFDGYLAVFLVEDDVSVGKGEQSVVATHSDILAGVEARAALANNDVARYYGFAAELLNAEILRVRVASVLGSALSFFMRHD